MLRCSILILIAITVAYASDFVPLQIAERAAEAHIVVCTDFEKGPFGHKIDRSMELTDSETGDILGYVFSLEPCGFIVTSANRRIRPIIAYSAVNPYDMDDSPANKPHAVLKHDLKTRNLALPRIKNSVVERNIQLWEDYLALAPRIFSIYPMALLLGPYLDTQWNQGAPYNMFCPIDPVTLARCPIGCVVTAMGQIINYWEWPPSVHFDSTDNYMSERTTPSIYVEADSALLDTIDWNAVGHQPDEITMARFLFGCGVSIHMQYQDGGSAAWSGEVVDALFDKYDYFTAMGIWPSSGSAFYSEIAFDVLEGRVSHLSITDGGDGHAIVVDGYRESGEYHVNYGWGGTADGWYFIPDSLPEGMSTVTYGIVGIMPPVITHRPITNLETEQLNGGYVKINWSRPTLITEPVLHYNVYRRPVSSTTDDLLGTTSTRQLIDTSFDELTKYTYSVGAVYDECGESRRTQKDAYSGIRNGWTKVLRDYGRETAMAIAPLDSGGFVAVGKAAAYAGGAEELFIVAMDLDGQMLWRKFYGGGSRQGANDVRGLDDGSYIIAGWQVPEGEVVSDVWLIKTDSDGDTIWTKTFGTAENDSAVSVEVTPGGGFLILAATGAESVWLIETDSDGNLIREATFGPNLVGRSITSVSTGGYALCGTAPSGTIGHKDIFVMKLDSSLDSVWLRHYGGASLDEGADIIESSSGEMVVVGKSRSFGMPLYTTTYAVLISADGDTIRSAFAGGMNNYGLNSITKTAEGYVAAGFVDLSSPGMYLQYFDDDLDTTHTHIYSTVGNEAAYDVLSLADDGLAIAGVTTLNGDEDCWVLKVGGVIHYGIEEDCPTKPESFVVRSYPNPFNSAVRIETPAGAEVQIFDIRGRSIAELDAGRLDSNRRMFTWKPDINAPSGVYFARVTLNGEAKTSRVVYLK